MKEQTKKIFCRTLCSMMMVLMLSSVCAEKALAAEMVQRVNLSQIESLQMSPRDVEAEYEDESPNMKALLYNCLIHVYSSSSGMLLMFETDCVQEADQIGVKDILIKQKVWYGWKTVATSSGGSRTNSTSYMGELLYTNAIKGETYRITCTHYADADEYTEVDGELEFIFTY